jgi:hypothetical protein
MPARERLALRPADGVVSLCIRWVRSRMTGVLGAALSQPVPAVMRQVAYGFA